MTYKQVKKYGFRDGLSEGDPEKVIYGQDFDGEFEAIEKAFEAIDPDTDGSVDINEIDGLQDALDNKADKNHTHDEYLTDAPNDGKQYVRESEAWAEVTIPEAGISEPTSDGKPYSRQVEGGQTVGAWVEAPTTDDIEYLDGRIDAIEGNISGGGGFVEAPDDGDDYARNGKSPAWVKTYNAEYIDALEADYKNADAGKADKDHNHAISDVTGLQTALDGKADAGHNHDSDYAPLGHTHTTDEITGLDDKISEIESDITDLEGAVGELTGQLAMGGSYNASTGLVVTANLSSFTAGQPLPDYSTVPNTFVIVVEAGNNPEELGEGDWLVAGQSGWVAIKYGTAGSVDWDNISNVPDFDLVYAPIDHTHEIADVDGLQDALDAATGESLWTQNGDDIYYSDGNVGIGTDKPARQLTIQKDGTALASLVNTAGGSCQLMFGDADSDVAGRIVYDNNGDYMRFDTNGGVPRMRIDASGNVGIGTDNPDSKLHVTESNATAHSPTADSTTNMSGLRLENSAGGNTWSGVWFQNGAHFSGIAGARTDDAGWGTHLSFFTHETNAQNLTQATERMRINASGNVGIGGEPSRSTKEIEEEAEATLRNWDSKDKKPTKAELIKKLAERNIGGGDAKLQVSGKIFASNQLQTAIGQISRPSTNTGLFFNDQRMTPTNAAGSYLDATMDLGKTDARWKDGYFSGTVNIGNAAFTSFGVRSTENSRGGIHFDTGNISPCNSNGSTTNGALDFGSSSHKWKDAHFSGTVNAQQLKSNYWVSPTAGRGGLLLASDGSLNPADNQGYYTDGVQSLGRNDGTYTSRFKDAHFSGEIHTERLSVGTLNVSENIGVQDSSGVARTVYDKSSNTIGGSTFKFVGDGSGLTNLPSSGGGAVDAYTKAESDSKYVPKSGNTTISGTLTATDFVATSDERLKDNVSPMPVGLIDDIKPVQWTWKDSGKKSAGVIAQQLQEVGLDDFVTEDEDGMLGVNYNALVSVLLAEVIGLKKELAR